MQSDVDVTLKISKSTAGKDEDVYVVCKCSCFWLFAPKCLQVARTYEWYFVIL